MSTLTLEDIYTDVTYEELLEICESDCIEAELQAVFDDLLYQ